MSLAEEAVAARIVENGIPVLDLGPFFAGEPGALEKVASDLQWASENVGFYYIANHGVPESLVDQTFATAKFFHDQPIEEKMKVKVNEDLQGYMAMRASTIRHSDLNTHKKPNQNEAFFMQREIDSSHPDFGKPYFTANQWPENMPGFKEKVLEYYNALDELTLKMLPIYGVALEMGPDFFFPAFKRSHSALRMTHYPPVEYTEGEFGIAPHTDSGFITLLAQNKVGGLQIRTTKGEWLDAPVIPGTFIVNTGDILHRWTNSRFINTPHRAKNVMTTAPRYAIPFFVHPDPHYRMECIPSCLRDGKEPRYPAQTTAEYMDWFKSRNYDHVREKKNITD